MVTEKPVPQHDNNTEVPKDNKKIHFKEKS